MAKDLVNLCHDLSVRTVILIGGEPTLYKEFFEIIRFIKSRGMTAGVVTNGAMFSSEEFLTKAEEAGLDEAVLSVKGSSEKEYILSTGTNAFSSTKIAIRNLQSSKIRCRISITVSGAVVENWSSWVDFATSCEVKRINFSFEKPVILSDSVAFDEKMMPYNIAPFIEDAMYPSLLTSGLDFKIEFMFPQCALSDGFVEGLEREGHAFGACTVIRETGLAFDPDGRVLPCNHFVDNYFGQYGKDFKSAEDFDGWFKIENIRNFYHTIKLAPCNECANCDRWSKCGGGCRIFWLYQGPKKLLSNKFASTKKGMEIKYSKKIDEEIFNEVNSMRKELSPIFGFNFPRVVFNEKIIPVAKAIARFVQVDEKKINTIMRTIYGQNMPEVVVYINTTPFSTWNVNEKYISISCYRFGKFFETVCHESNHFMYDVVFKSKKYQNNKTKETITVLNNIFGVEDRGWEKFFENRKKVLNYYKKTKNFKKTIEYAKIICE